MEGPVRIRLVEEAAMRWFEVKVEEATTILLVSYIGCILMFVALGFMFRSDLAAARQVLSLAQEMWHAEQNSVEQTRQELASLRQQVEQSLATVRQAQKAFAEQQAELRLWLLAAHPKAETVLQFDRRLRQLEHQ